MSELKLEAQACRVFVCPNMKVIDQLCDCIMLDMIDHPSKAGLKYDLDQMKRVSKAVAAAYFKKTYIHPKYASPAPVIASCVYVAGKMTGNWVTQQSISRHSGYQQSTIRKWSHHVYHELADSLQELSAS